ncbi:hypothetical protein [Roseibium aggregatum]|uniref:hypothetical protein n=1 Tax=Roseibium aggregatum TaxID=187304 RepID=UPI00094B71A2|nr:hypothetical protein [Roseibium aggregatum]UFI06646.1 hypothetical protein ST40_028515 [Roseibium aggregatum]
MREEDTLSTRVKGYSANRGSIDPKEWADYGRAWETANASDIAQERTSIKLRLADGSETDCRAGIHLAREAHLRPIFRDIPFSEAKARAIFDKAKVEPERFGLNYAVLGADKPLAEDGLLGFASVQAREHFLGQGTLIATV